MSRRLGDGDGVTAPADTPPARHLYTIRAGLYGFWMKLFRHQQALSALFEHSDVLRPDMRILDAGCGSGAATFALIDALRRRGVAYRSIDAFDFTAAMLERLGDAVRRRRLDRVRLSEADVLGLDEQLPASWTDYDLIVCTSMLEYVPSEKLQQALEALRRRMALEGTLLVVTTRKNALAKAIVEHGWKAHGYRADELEDALRRAGFPHITFRSFPARCFWMNTTNHVVIAR
jgi:SAM-dependent methyltransferase